MTQTLYCTQAFHFPRTETRKDAGARAAPCSRRREAELGATKYARVADRQVRRTSFCCSLLQTSYRKSGVRLSWRCSFSQRTSSRFCEHWQISSASEAPCRPPYALLTVQSQWPAFDWSPFYRSARCAKYRASFRVTLLVLSPVPSGHNGGRCLISLLAYLLPGAPERRCTCE